MSSLKNEYLEMIKKNEETAYGLNKFLANNPELSGHEYQAVAEITRILEEKGIEVEKKLAGVDTSFIAHIAKSDENSPKVGILMEYDALPGVGHACGHSASGSLSLLSALTLWEMKDQYHATVDLIGTPNEEVKGDKITLADAGVFDEYDAVMMIHMNSNETFPSVHFLALSEIRVSFTGKTAHAAAAPWEGRNALNAASLSGVAIDMMRQQLKPDSRVAYIVTKGGEASNVIPDEAEMVINMRNANKFDLEKTYDKIINCVKGAALATGTEYQIEKTGPNFDDMNINQTGVEVIKEIMDSLDIPNTVEPQGASTGSSDIGNVSYVCPAFHPMMAISDHYFALHTKEVADIMKSDSIHQVILKGAEVIGLFFLRLIEDPKLLEEVKQEFEKSLSPS